MIFRYFLAFAFFPLLLMQSTLPNSFEVFSMRSSYSMGDAITDSTLNPSKNMLYASTFYKGVIVLSIKNMSSIIEFFKLYSFFTAGNPIMVKSLNDYYVCVVSSAVKGEIIEIYEVSSSSATLLAASDWLSSSDIRDMVVSNDSNYIFGVDYEYGLFILDVNNKSKVTWAYKSNDTNMKSTNLALSKNETFLYYYINGNDNGFQMVDVSNPRNISILSENVLFEYFIDSPINGFIIYNDVAIVTFCEDGYNDFITFDSSNNFLGWAWNGLKGTNCELGAQQTLTGFRDSDVILGVSGGTQLNYLSIVQQYYLVDVPESTWSYPSSKAQVLSKTHIIQEDGPSGMLYSLVLTTFVPPWAFLSRSRYISNYFNNHFVYNQNLTNVYKIIGPNDWMSTQSGWTNVNCILKINPTTLFIGMSNYGAYSGFLCNFTINRSQNRINPTYYVNGFVPYIDVNNITLTSNGVYETLNRRTLKVLLDTSGRYFITFTSEWDSASYHINIYNASKTQNFENLQRVKVPAGSNSVSMAQVDEFLYWVSTGSSLINFKNCIGSLNFSNLTNASTVFTNICTEQSVLHAAIGGCMIGRNSYVFYKLSTDPYLHIAIVSPTDFWNLTEINTFFIDDQMSVMTVKNASSCDVLYTGGDSFRVFNISDPYAITMAYTTIFPNIQTITFVTEFALLYIVNKRETFLYDVINPLKPRQLSMTQTNSFENTYSVTGYVADPEYRGLYVFEGGLGGDFFGQDLNILNIGQPPLFLNVEIVNDKLYVRITTVYSYKFQFLRYDYVSPPGLMVYDGDILIPTAYLVTPNFKLKTMPTWIYFDSVQRTISITAPKENENSNISIYFDCNYSNYLYPILYNQIITFPIVYSSLKIAITSSNKIKISSPSQSSLILTIQVDPSSIFLIQDSFTGVLISYAKETGTFVANGNLNNLNNMLLNLRYACRFNNLGCQTSINLTISDQINNDETMLYLSISSLNQDNSPFISLKKEIQNQLDQSLISSNYQITPNLKFLIQLYSKTYQDLDEDALSYTIVSQNQTKRIPSWLFFDAFNLIISGIPSLEDEGSLSLIMNVTDGYYYILDSFTLQIFDNPPSIDIALSKQLNDSECLVGELFNFVFQPFLDVDGPDILSYSAVVTDAQNKEIILSSSTSQFWLRFDSKTRTLAGSPTKNDLGSINITIIANDGLKNGNDTFTLTIFPSFSANYYSNGYPLLITKNQNNMIQAHIKSNGNTKILLPIYYQNLLGLINVNSSLDQKTIIINGTASQINSSFSVLTFRDKKEAGRLINENLTVIMYDSFNQIQEIQLSKSFLKNDTDQLSVHIEYTSPNYFCEVGSFFRVTLNKAIFTLKDPNIKLYYRFNLTDNSGNEQDFLSIDQNLNLISLKSIDESLIGKYRATLNATDEFNENAIINFTIEINYPLSEIIQQWFKQLAGFLSSLTFIITLYKFYYLFFNWWFDLPNEMSDEIVIKERYFKRKFAFIQKEFELAQKYYKVYLKRFKNAKKEILNDKTELENHIQNIMLLIPPQIKINHYFNETVECILEGLILINTMQNTPSAMKTFNLIKANMQKKQRVAFGKKVCPKRWFSEFFISENSISQKVDVELAKNEDFLVKSNDIKSFLLQKGKFKDVEKHCFINEDVFNSFYENSLKKIKINIKYKGDPKNFKVLILKAIILYKRGILLDNNPILLYLNKFLSKLTFNCISFVHGDSIHAEEFDVQNIISKWSDQKNPSKFCGSWLGLKENIFSLSTKTVPYWIEVIQKGGVLIFKGVAILSEQKYNYRIEVRGPNFKNLFHFWLRIYKDENEFGKKFTKTISMLTSVNRSNFSSYSLNDRADKFRKKHHLKTRKIIKKKSFLPNVPIEAASGIMSATITEKIEEKLKKSTFIELELTPLTIPNQILTTNENNINLMTEKENLTFK